MSIKDRYNKLIEHFADNNKRMFSRKIDAAPTVIENIVGTRETKPSFDVIEKTLFAFENINARWLITGKGEMIEENKKETNSDISALNKIVELAQENLLLKQELEKLKKDPKKNYPLPKPMCNIAAEP